MKVNGIPTRTIWSVDHGQAIGIIDQTRLPFEFRKEILPDWQSVRDAISTMKVRGAPLIGITGAWGMVLAIGDNPEDDFIHEVRSELISSRPTAVNLQWAVDHIVKKVMPLAKKDRLPVAYREAEQMTQNDARDGWRRSTTARHCLRFTSLLNREFLYTFGLMKRVRVNKGF